MKFDLIDFSDFMYDKIGYKLKIMIIFSILGGTLGYFALYGILLILNNMDEDKKGIKRFKNGYYPYSNYSTIKEYKPPSKVRNIKPINFSRNKTDDERSNNRYNNKLPGSKINNNSKLKRNLTPDKYKNNNNSNNNIKGDVIYNNVRKVEMKNLENNIK